MRFQHQKPFDSARSRYIHPTSPMGIKLNIWHRSELESIDAFRVQQVRRDLISRMGHLGIRFRKDEDSLGTRYRIHFAELSCYANIGTCVYWIGMWLIIRVDLYTWRLTNRVHENTPSLCYVLYGILASNAVVFLDTLMERIRCRLTSLPCATARSITLAMMMFDIDTVRHSTRPDKDHGIGQEQIGSAKKNAF